VVLDDLRQHTGLPNKQLASGRFGGHQVGQPATIHLREENQMGFKRFRHLLWFTLGIGVALTVGTITYAQSGKTDTGAAASAVTRPDGWGKETHSNDVAPNYDVVFPQDRVNQLTITIAPDDWEAMQDNMTELFGEPGARRRGPGGGFGFAPPANGAPSRGNAQPPSPLARPDGEGFAPPAPGEAPAGFPPPPAGGFGGDFTPENPMWVAATIEFNGHTWTHVGVRYKGNSSLRSGWDSGSRKLPFKLDFDQFEDDYPEIKNQRFYGFKQLSLANGFGDNTFMRDAITYDLLEAAGLVAAETAPYEIILDYGEGPVSLGLYTMIEVIDDTVIQRAFGDDSGNIYEGDGRGASLAEGTFDLIQDSFQKENNKNEADWSDIEALYEVLHAEERTTDPAAWRADLEATFDVDSFLEWLAISAMIQHWDTYGAMTHNFYLYHNPESDQLTWISWDHNLVLGARFGPGGMGGRPASPGAAGVGGAPMAPPAGRQPAGRMGGPGGMGGRNTSLDKADVGDNWPLIRYLLDDPTYYERYLTYLAESREEMFDPDVLAEKYQAMAAVIAPVAAEEIGQATFEAAVEELTERTYERAEAVDAFLAEQ
jgi:spore coat protein H